MNITVYEITRDYKNEIGKQTETRQYREIIQVPRLFARRGLWLILACWLFALWSVYLILSKFTVFVTTHPMINYLTAAVRNKLRRRHNNTEYEGKWNNFVIGADDYTPRRMRAGCSAVYNNLSVPRSVYEKYYNKKLTRFMSVCKCIVNY